MSWFRRRPKRKKSPVRDWIESIVVAVVCALVLRAFVIQAFKIPSGSMEKTLLIGDFLIVNKFLYGTKKGDLLLLNFFRESQVGKALHFPQGYNRFLDSRILPVRQPKRGDVIVFKYPFGSRDFIKRCVGTPGDTIEIRNKMLYVNGVQVEERYTMHIDRMVTPGLSLDRTRYQAAWQGGQFQDAGRMCRDNFGPVVVPDNYYFMMGDNRDNSEDSRFWGPLHNRFIKGKAMVIYWSWKKEVPLFRFWKKIRWRRIAHLIR
jgi:signal peptidase I